MRKFLLTFTITMLSTVGITAQNYVHIVQLDSTTTLNLNDIKSIDYVVDDYVPFAKGTYTSWFFNNSKEATLEYSPNKDLYRFKDCWIAGYDVTFKFDLETFAITMTSSAYASGHVHPSFGMVMATVYNNGALNEYDSETGVFYFAYQWTVDAGSFGAGYDTFQITELCENGQSLAPVAKAADKKNIGTGIAKVTLQPRTEKPQKTATIKKVTDECVTE